MPQKVIYFKDEDYKFYEKALELSGGQPLARVVLDALKLYILSKESQEDVIFTIKKGDEEKTYIGKEVKGS